MNASSPKNAYGRNRRRFAHQLLSAAVLGAASLGAGAQSLPDRPLRWVIPFGAGSAVDTIGRAIANQVAAQTGQTMVIDNRTGANGIIAAEMVAKSPGDGTTLFMPNDGILAANPVLYAKLPTTPCAISLR